MAVLRRLEQGGRLLFDALPVAAQRQVRTVARRPGPRRIALDALDAELARAAELFSESEDAARIHLASFELAPPAGQPDDPFSPAYEAWTWELYKAISGRPAYSLDNEASPFDLPSALERPVPFSTGSATVVGEDLEARGRILRALGTGRLPGVGTGTGAGLAPPATIVEFGPGWGNLTVDLLATGFDVTAVEVDPGFCALLEARAPAGGQLRVVRADMLSYRPDAPADAAVFFESFHHCADHRSMLGHLHEVVRPDGVVLFAGEPVHPMPYPWGPRLDGLSLWSTRTYGWLELGFDPRYFRAALARAGWCATYHRARYSPKAELHLARPSPAAGGAGGAGMAGGARLSPGAPQG